MPISPFYASPYEEKGALRRASARAGCRVVELGAHALGDVGGRMHEVGRVACADGWAAARLVLALAVEDSDTDGARELAAELWRGVDSRRAFVSRVQRFVRNAIAFVRDKGEVFGGPDYLFELGEGDCEDQARVVYAILRAGGVPVRLALLHRGGDPTHAVTQAEIDGRPEWVETTIAAELGEHPNRAAERLGLADERTDLAEGVRTMSEKNLAPVPARFRKVNAPQQVELDAQALMRLGYLVENDARAYGDPADLTFRAAVIAFQEHAGIVADGLIGPQTRRTIAGALAKDEFGMGYVAATSTTASRTRHLSPAFFAATEAMAEALRKKGAPIDAFDLLAVWNSESGVRRAAVGHGKYATLYAGLNMMMRSPRPAVGRPGTIEEYAALDPADQVPYVLRFYEQNVRAFLGGDWSRLPNATALYMMNFTPAFIAHAAEPDYVIARKGDPKTGWIYDANPVFDDDRKGTILVRDMGDQIEDAKRSDPGYWAELVARQKAEGQSTAVGGGGSGLLVGGVLVAIAGGLAWWAAQS